MEYYNTVNPNSNDYSASLASNDNKLEKKKKTGKKSGKGVRLSTDPQSVAARERRHRISERFKILQSLVPGGSKMDTVSMLDEAIHYVKYLKTRIWLHQTMVNFVDDDPSLFLPSSFASQQVLYSQPDLVVPVQPSPPEALLPNSYFQGGETVYFDGYMKY